MRVDVILDSRAAPAELAQLGRLAERFGLDGAWVSSLLDSRDPFANLMPMALATRRLRLGPVAVNPWDTHPVRIAAGLLTLNEAAGGRARLVVGGGGEALRALGIEPARRVRAVRECLEILRAASTGERVDYEGELYRVRGLRFGWLASPPPALYAGASQAQMLRMAAAGADGAMLSDMPREPMAEALRTLHAALAAAGRGGQGYWTGSFTAWHVYEDEAEALAEARRWLYLRGIFRPWLLAQFLDESEVALVMRSEPAFARAFAAGEDRVEGVSTAVLDRIARHVTLCGTPDTLEPLLVRLREFTVAGLASVALRLYARPADSIRLLGRRVLPALAE